MLLRSREPFINKRTRLNSLLILLAYSLLFLFSCKKDENTPINDPVTPTSNFKWSTDGSASVTASEAYFIAAYNNIVATKSGSTASVDVVLDDLKVGSHAISASTGITLEFVNQGTTYTGESGTVVISQNTGTLLSGSFSAQLSGGTIKTITGSFTDLKEK